MEMVYVVKSRSVLWNGSTLFFSRGVRCWDAPYRVNVAGASEGGLQFNLVSCR